VSQRVSCILGDITELDIPPVDAVLAYAVLHHVPDRLHEFSQAIARVLKPQGVFIFCEPLCYSPAIEWFRDHSGVARDALDPGERKLTGKDLRIIAANFAGMDAVHFHILGRWSRVVPRLDRQFRQVDRWLKLVPGSHLLAGSVIGVCRK
jgi:SAM-dependent methyltransferase